MPDQPIPTFPTRAELCRRLGITEDLPDWTQEEVIRARHEPTQEEDFMTLPTIPCQAFTADGLSKGTTTDIASELVKIGALHKPTKLEKQAAKFTSRINRAIVDTLSEHHVRVLKSGAFRKSLSPAKQRARQRQLNALGCLLDKAIVKAAIEVDRDEARATRQGNEQVRDSQDPA